MSPCVPMSCHVAHCRLLAACLPSVHINPSSHCLPPQPTVHSLLLLIPHISFPPLPFFFFPPFLLPSPLKWAPGRLLGVSP